ncbi:hypothetical protein LINPERHAP1_LOCUS22207, partial [Linum perenne]
VVSSSQLNQPFVKEQRKKQQPSIIFQGTPTTMVELNINFFIGGVSFSQLSQVVCFEF